MRTVAHHRRVGVSHRQDARLQGNLLADEATWITATIGALAVAEDPPAYVFQIDIAQNRRCELGLTANLGPLLPGQRAFLVDDLG